VNRIALTKMSGCGNDFILVDNRRLTIAADAAPDLAKRICRRRLSVGADGLILIEDDPDADFRWRFFNSDGSPAEMCGNGARCAARFAFVNGIAGETMHFNTTAGTIAARIVADGGGGHQVQLRMTAPGPLTTALPVTLRHGGVTVSTVDTGVPHAVLFVDDVDGVDVVDLGREIRRHACFQPAGTNANFVARAGEGRLRLRTYERGVEDETLACGTGAVASALAAAQRWHWPSPVSLETRSGGVLKVHFQQSADGFDDVLLEGDARFIYTGTLHEEA